MEYVKAVVGEAEMYVPVNNRLGELILLAQRRLNYQKHIAKMRKAYQGKIESELVVMDSEFFYALEDVMEEKGYDGVIHYQFGKCTVEHRKIYYDLFRSDKTISYLVSVCGYRQEVLQDAIRNFFESLKKIIF